MALSVGLIDNNDIYDYDLLLPDEYLNYAGAQYIGLLDDDDYPVGVLCFTLGVDVVDILYFGSYEQDKKIEYSKLMLEYLESLVQENQIGVPIEIIWTEEEDAFYRELLSGYEEFSIVEDASCYTLTPEARANSNMYKRLSGQSSNTSRYCDLSDSEKSKLRRQLREEDLDMFLESDGSYIKDLSIVSIENNEVKAAIFFTRVMGAIELSFIYASNNQTKQLAGVISEAMRIVDEKYADEIIEFTAVNEESLKLVQDVFGDELVAAKNYVGISFGRI